MSKYIQKKRLTNAGWDCVSGWLFCMPLVLGFVFFYLSSLITYIVMAFSDMKINAEGNIQFLFNGSENFYDAIFVQDDYLIKVFSNLGDLFIMFPAVLLFSFFIAILLNQKFRGRIFARVIFFLPVIIASGVCALSQSDALTNTAVSAVSGMNGNADGTLNLTTAITSILGNSMDSSIFSIVETLVSKIYTIVMSSGVQILTFLAGLQAIPDSLYEASSIEGATAWENLWKITLPMISPIILVNAVYTIVDILGSTSNTLVNDLYTIAMDKMEYGLSAAMGTIYFGITLVLVCVVIFLISRVVFYEEK